MHSGAIALEETTHSVIKAITDPPVRPAGSALSLCTAESSSLRSHELLDKLFHTEHKLSNSEEIVLSGLWLQSSFNYLCDQPLNFFINSPLLHTIEAKHHWLCENWAEAFKQIIPSPHENLPQSMWKDIAFGLPVDIAKCLPINAQAALANPDIRKIPGTEFPVVSSDPCPKKQLSSFVLWFGAFASYSVAVSFLFPELKPVLDQYAREITELHLLYGPESWPQIYKYDIAKCLHCAADPSLSLLDTTVISPAFILAQSHPSGLARPQKKSPSTFIKSNEIC